jgi:uncharacterized protein (DUF4415 family)
MIEKERDTKLSLGEEDEPVEWTDEMFARAQISVGGKVIREATGTLTKRGRPPVGDVPKQQVTLRLPPHVLEHFKAGGAGWQTRIGEVLERHAAGTSGEQARSSGVEESRSPYMAKSEQTSKKAGTAASKVLKSGSTGKNSKTAAGSALTQRPDKNK